MQKVFSGGSNLLKAWIANQGITQRVLAERLGITDQHMSGVVNGKETPSLQLAARIERETGIPASAFAEVA